MKQTVEIEVPDGKKAVWKDGKVDFEDIEPQLPNTWKEFCKNLNISERTLLLLFDVPDIPNAQDGK